MAKVNLDAVRAARSEAQQEPHEVEFGGETFLFTPEMPLEFAELLANARLSSAVRVLLVNGADLDRFLALKPLVSDMEAIASLYGMGSLGESTASAESSKNTSNGSRPTSSASTVSNLPSLPGAPAA